MFIGNMGGNMAFGPSAFILLFVFVAYLLICIFFLRWCARTARKVARSPIGFAWLGFFAPIIAWAILLTLNKDDKYLV